jgi:excisionase family DNA binding protein
LTELLVSTAEAARRVGVGKTKFFELLKDDQIKAVRLGRRTLVPVAELERFAAMLPARSGPLTSAKPLDSCESELATGAAELKAEA